MTFKVAGIVGSPRKGMNIDLVDTLVVTIQSMRRVPEKENNFLIGLSRLENHLYE